MAVVKASKRIAPFFKMSRFLNKLNKALLEGTSDKEIIHVTKTIMIKVKEKIGQIKRKNKKGKSIIRQSRLNQIIGAMIFGDLDKNIVNDYLESTASKFGADSLWHGGAIEMPSEENIEIFPAIFKIPIVLNIVGIQGYGRPMMVFDGAFNTKENFLCFCVKIPSHPYYFNDFHIRLKQLISHEIEHYYDMKDKDWKGYIPQTKDKDHGSRKRAYFTSPTEIRARAAEARTASRTQKISFDGALRAVLARKRLGNLNQEVYLSILKYANERWPDILKKHNEPDKQQRKKSIKRRMRKIRPPQDL